MGDRPKPRACAILSQLIAFALLVALIPSGYLTFEYYLKPLGEQQLKKYASQVSVDNINITRPELGGNGANCIKCIGMNTVFPVTSTSHPTYSSFQVVLINNSGWFTSMLTSAGVAIGGGGSLLFTILNLAHGVQGPPAHSTTSSTAYNGAGIFEMVFLVSQAQFMTMLGAMQLDGLPLFFLEFCRKLAWTNLLIFPSETSYTPVKTVSDQTRRLLSLTSTTGVERYSELVGVKPHHLFYYTCIALAVALGAILVIYGILRLIIAAITKDDTPKTLDHRVIWVFLQLLVLMQYIVATTASFQIYITVSTNRSLGDIGLAIVFLSLVCIGVMVFGIIKIARHRDLVETHGTPAYDEKKPFHLRYSVYYQDYTVNNIYFFVVKMLLGIACGAIVGTVQSPSLQTGIMVALNALYLFLLIGRKPYLVPLFYSVSVFTGFLRIIILMLTLVHTQDNKFPQDTRDLAAVWIIGLNIALLVAVLIRQFYTLSVAIYKWASRPKPATDDSELGIPLQELPHKKSNRNEENATSTDVPRKSSTSGTKRLSTKKRSSRPPVSPPSDDTLFAAQPYRELSDRHSMDGYTTGTSTDSTTRSSRTKGGGRRSFYSHQRNRAARQKKLDAVKDENLPGWAQV